MNNKGFKFISTKKMNNANNAAIQLVKELNEQNIESQVTRSLYYIFIEAHSIIHHGVDGDKIYEELNDVFNLLDSIHFEKDVEAFNIFWNHLLTNDTNGKKCEVDEFMKNMRLRYGESNKLLNYFNNIIQLLYPNYNEEKLETYKLEFVHNDKVFTATFKGRISQDEINNLIKYFEETFNDYMHYEIEHYLAQHHLEYSDFEYEYKL